MGLHFQTDGCVPQLFNRNSACFFKIRNNTELPDTLIDASSNIAKLVQFHLSFNDSDGTMGMKQVLSIPIEANSVFYFKLGSYHIMLIGMNKTMKLDTAGKITLEFKNAGEKSLIAVVRESGQM